MGEQEDKHQSWDKETLFFSGDDYFVSMLSYIRGAARSIDLQTYIFRHDETGRLFESELREAAKRGVRVRLLVDGFGASAFVNAVQEETLHAVELRVYHPVHFSQIFSRILRAFGLAGRQALLSRKALALLNRRSHSKLCLVDQSHAWVGSFNITSVHSETISNEKTWRDTGLYLQGKAVARLTEAFEHVWLRAHIHRKPRRWLESLYELVRESREPSDLVLVNYSPGMRSRNLNQLIRAIDSTKVRVWITNAYYAPPRALALCLRRAARRGVDVRLLVPRDSDVFFMPWVATSHYPRLLNAGARIYEYQPRFLHAKSMILDDLAIVGSSNLNRRSLSKDFEIDVTSKNVDTVSKLTKQFLLDLQSSVEVTDLKPGLRAFLGRMISRLFRELI